MRVWDATTGQQVWVLRGHTYYVDHVRFSPDGRKIASSGHDGTIRIWDSTQGKLLLTLRQGNYVHVCAFSPDGNRIAGASFNNSIKVWDSTTGKLVLDRRHTSKAWGVKYSPAGTSLINSTRSVLHVWDSETGKPLYQFPAPNVATAFALDPFGRRIAGRFVDNRVAVWDVSDLLTPNK